MTAFLQSPSVASESDAGCGHCLDCCGLRALPEPVWPGNSGDCAHDTDTIVCAVYRRFEPLERLTLRENAARLFPSAPRRNAGLSSRSSIQSRRIRDRQIHCIRMPPFCASREVIVPGYEGCRAPFCRLFQGGPRAPGTSNREFRAIFYPSFAFSPVSTPFHQNQGGAESSHNAHSAPPAPPCPSNVARGDKEEWPGRSSRSLRPCTLGYVIAGGASFVTETL